MQHISTFLLLLLTCACVCQQGAELQRYSCSMSRVFAAGLFCLWILFSVFLFTERMEQTDVSADQSCNSPELHSLLNWSLTGSIARLSKQPGRPTINALLHPQFELSNSVKFLPVICSPALLLNASNCSNVGRKGRYSPVVLALPKVSASNRCLGELQQAGCALQNAGTSWSSLVLSALLQDSR